MEHWPPQRRHIDAAYADVIEPEIRRHFAEVERREIPMTQQMPLTSFLGYVRSWSGLKYYKEKHDGEDPSITLEQELRAAFGPDAVAGADPEVVITWPVFMLLARRLQD